MKLTSGFATALLLIFGGVFCWPSFANAQGAQLNWKREPAQALSQAKQQSKGVLAFFHDASSQESSRLLTTLSESKLATEIDTAYVPLMMDMVNQKAVAAQLGVTQSGVLVVYSDQGQAITMLKQNDTASPDALATRLRAIATQQGYLTARAAAPPALTPAFEIPGAGAAAASPGFASPAVGASANTAATGIPTPIPLPSSAASPQVTAIVTPIPTPSSSATAQTPNVSSPAAAKFEPFPNAVSADNIAREQLGNQVTVTGQIIVFESSTAQTRPYILQLSKRAQDALQVVYWPQTAEVIHAGRPIPKEGDLVSVRGKLTDYRGKLQIKVDQPDQFRYAPQP